MSASAAPPPPPISRQDCLNSRASAAGRRLLLEAMDISHALGVALWVISPDGKSMQGALAVGPTGPIIEQSEAPINQSVVGMVACNGLSASIGPEDFHNPSIDAKTGVTTIAMIAAPVYVRGKIAGVVSAINPKHGGLFSSEDQDLLAWKAHLLGLVLADAVETSAG